MKKVHKAVIEAAEELYDRSDADYGTGLFDAVRAMRAAREARAGITVEPPVGSRVEDCDGDVWTRREDGWQFRAFPQRELWSRVTPYAPLKLIMPASNES